MHMLVHPRARKQTSSSLTYETSKVPVHCAQDSKAISDLLSLLLHTLYMSYLKPNLTYTNLGRLISVNDQSCQNLFHTSYQSCKFFDLTSMLELIYPTILIWGITNFPKFWLLIRSLRYQENIHTRDPLWIPPIYTSSSIIVGISYLFIYTKAHE